MKPFILIVALVCTVWGGNLAAQYYVSPKGLNSNPGTLEQPFKTIQQAARVMEAGDTCFIMAGSYRETVIPLNNGTKTAPIVFTNYKNDRIVVLGSKTVSNWKKYQNGIYKSYFPDSVSQLFVNRQRAVPAQYPDLLSNNIFNTEEWNDVEATADGDAVFENMNKPEGYWAGGYCKILTGKRWVAHIGEIKSSNGNVVHCINRSARWSNVNPKTYLGKGKGVIFHHLHALDHPNEWHWQNDTLYFFPHKGADINTLTAEARTRMYGFNCRDKQYIEIKNIHFVWATVNFENATGCVLNSGSVWYGTPFYYYKKSWDRQDAQPPDYSIARWQGKGIAVSGTGNIIKNCYVAYSYGDGISIGGINNRVENCLIEHCDWSATDAAPLCATGKNHNILHNTIRTAGRSVLVHRLCNSTNIKFNDLYNCGLMCDDLGLTYSYHTNGEGSEIAYNYVHDNHATGTASGIYLDNYDTSYVVHHNVVWNCALAIQTNKPAVGHKIYNNTVWNCTHAQWAWGRAGTEIENQQVANNLSDKPWNVGTLFNNNLTTDNPMFVNPDSGDFRLQPGSPAIDHGTIIPNITDDYIGNAPDAGAYEYGGKNWQPGSNISIPDLSDIVLPLSQ